MTTNKWYKIEAKSWKPFMKLVLQSTDTDANTETQQKQEKATSQKNKHIRHEQREWREM